MSDPNCGRDPLDPTLQQVYVPVVAKAEVIQPLGLSPTDVTGRGIALGVNICVVPDEASQCSSPARSIESRMSCRLNAMTSVFSSLRAQADCR